LGDGDPTAQRLIRGWDHHLGCVPAQNVILSMVDWLPLATEATITTFIGHLTDVDEVLLNLNA
jgi:hypothetical protein